MKEQLATTFKWEVERVTFETGQTAYFAWVVKDAEYMDLTLDRESESRRTRFVEVKRVRTTRHGVKRSVIKGEFLAMSEEGNTGVKFFSLTEAKQAAELACERMEKHFRENNIIHREVVS